MNMFYAYYVDLSKKVIRLVRRSGNTVVSPLGKRQYFDGTTRTAADGYGYFTDRKVASVILTAHCGWTLQA